MVHTKEKQKRTAQTTEFPKRRVVLALIAIVLAWLAVWSSAVGGAFLFDDIPQIVQNASVHDPASMRWLQDGRRPVTNLTIALNWAASGDNTFTYHLVNNAIHLVAALAIFGVVLITGRSANISAKWRDRAPYLAAFTALLWLVHPLQTQSVTYIIQRGESLAGMFYALTMLFAAIGIRREEAGKSGSAWLALAVLPCALGMGAKAVVVTAPVAVLLWDAVFGGHGFAGALRKRWTLHASLALTWLIVLWLGVLPQVFSTDAERTVGFGYRDASWWQYLMTQALVLWHYVRLSLWPDPLVIDYAWRFDTTFAKAFVPGAAILLAVLVSLWGLLRQKWWGFAGAFFFLVLAPTSSFIPIADAAMEHRMYLPLAALLLFAVVGLVALADRLTNGKPLLIVTPVLLIAAVGLSMRTIDRNFDYRDPRAMWQQVTIDRPENARAWSNYSKLVIADDPETAIIAAERAIEIDPDFVLAYVNLTTAFVETQQFERAVEEAESALENFGDDAGLLINLGRGLFPMGDLDASADAFRRAVELAPGSVAAKENLALVESNLALRSRARTLSEENEIDESEAAYREYLSRIPRDHATIIEFVEMMLADGRTNDILPLLERAIEGKTHSTKAALLHHRVSATIQGRDVVLEQSDTVGEFSPSNSQQWYEIALKNIEEGRTLEAEEALRTAIGFDPTNTSARYRLGVLLQKQEFYDEAAIEYEELIALQPDRASALSNLGQCYFRMGDVEAAESAFRRAADSDATHHRSRLNLAILLDALERYDEAIQWYERVLEIAPGHDRAEQRLRTLRRAAEEGYIGLDESTP